MKRKALSMFLALVMVLGLLPATALAVEPGLTITGGLSGSDYSYSDGRLTVLTGTPLTISGTATTDLISINAGVNAKVTFENLSIKRPAASVVANANGLVSVGEGATLNLTLKGDNLLWNVGSSTIAAISTGIITVQDAGKHTLANGALVIDGTGTLTAISKSDFTIGGSGLVTDGVVEGADITIKGGTVNAYNLSGNGAAIGSTGKLRLTITGGTVNAFGAYHGLELRYAPGDGEDFNTYHNDYDIDITGGTVKFYGCVPFTETEDGCTPGQAGTAQDATHSYGIWADGPNAAATRRFHVGGTAVVEAVGYRGGAVFGEKDAQTTSPVPVNILVDGSAQLTAYGMDKSTSHDIGLGSEIGKFGHGRTITLTGDAVVSLGKIGGGSYGDNVEKESFLGGGDNSQSTIILSGNAVLKCASGIGSSGYDNDTAKGYDGGAIQILDNASIGFMGGYQSKDPSGGIMYKGSLSTGGGYIGGGHASGSGAVGGSGGDITINTTGMVRVNRIGGGMAQPNTTGSGGDGGDITITNGKLFVSHIGGGRAGNSDTGTYTGGSGGNITINGGVFRGTSGRQMNTATVDSGGRSYANSSAVIGGGGAYSDGGTATGGSGGTIVISGGDFSGEAAIWATDNYGTGGVTHGGAVIGGGNGGSGGSITINGGVFDFSIYDNTNSPDDSSQLPALIGGGSGGGAGTITINGGSIRLTGNGTLYGIDASNLGAGKGATDATGWVKMTGGSMEAVGYKDNASYPKTWPTAADGSSTLYPVRIQLQTTSGVPAGVELSREVMLVSMNLTQKSNGQTYAYGIQDLSIAPKNSYGDNWILWLPVPGGHAGLTTTPTAAYDIALKVRKDNTVHTISGTISFLKPAPGDHSYNYFYYKDNVAEKVALAYGGESIETLQLTSDWGTLPKTYDGTDKKPAFTVKNAAGEVLTQGTHYTLAIEGDLFDGSTGNWLPATAMKNAGTYRATATGMAGTAYAGMTATLGDLHINSKEIPATYSGGAITKQYDGNDNLMDGAGEKITTLSFTIDSGDLVSGDSLTNITAADPRYETTGVGTAIPIIANLFSYTYTQGGVSSNLYNYSIKIPDTLKGDITVKVLGESNLSAAGVTVSKTYDGTISCVLANVSGSVTLVDLVGEELATVNITAVTAYDDKDAGTGKTVTLTIGDLSGANSGNYTLAGGATTIQVTNAKILPADYSYSLTEQQQRQEFTQGGDLTQISLPQDATGIGAERVAGTVTLHTDAACTVAATDDWAKTLTPGEHSLYVKFVPNSSETNYTDKDTTGKVVVLNVVEGAPQTMSWSGGNSGLMTTYGTPITGKTATVSEPDGGDITYSCSDDTVATVDASTGALTIVGAGTATITATAARVEGKYRETTITYPLTVSQKSITVTAEDKTKAFGQDNPTLTFAHDGSDLVSGDTADDLAVTLTTAAVKTSPVIDGGYAITGSSTSANYAVTVTPGTLTVNKAAAPTVAAQAVKNLLYSAAHSNVDVAITGLPTDCGTVTFTPGSVTDTGSILSGGVTGTATGIRFSTNIGAEDQTVTIPVTIAMQNYEDATVDVVVKLVNKTEVTITGVTVSGKTYDGAALAYSGTPGNEQGYTGTYEYIWSTTDGAAPKDAGSYTLTVKIADDNADFMGQWVSEAVVIAPKALTAKPKSISIYNGDTLPTAFELEYLGLVTGDTLTPVGTPTYALQKSDGTPLTASTINGSYVIKWTNADTVTLTSANYTITKADGALTISDRPSGGGGGGGGAVTPPPSTPEISTGGGSSTATVEAPSKTTGNTTNATVSNDTIKSAIEAAEKAAASSGTTPALEIKADVPAGATELVVTLPKTALDSFSASKAETLTITSGLGEITLPSDTAASIAKQAGSGDIKVTLGQVDTQKSLSEKQRAAVGDAPVYDISITAAGKHITDFDGGLMTIALPYTLKPGENPAGVVVWYVDEVGNIQKVTSMYDTKTKTIIFTTNHLSLYAIGYDANAVWENPFSDVAEDAWYYAAVQYAHQNNLFSGTTATTFAPNVPMTRAMLWVVLYRQAGSPAMTGAADIWYGAAQVWAKDKGISDGTNPDSKITREQLVTILYRYAASPQASGSLEQFGDVQSISAYAKDAMLWAVSAKIMQGDGGKLMPQGSATRAQVASMLMRYLTSSK